MWFEISKKNPLTEDIVLVAVFGTINLVRDIAWYDIDGDCWENLKGERINVVLWNDEDLPTIPDNFYNSLTDNES